MSIQSLSLAKLAEGREQLNRLNNGQKINDDAGACQFIRERGFAMLMPLTELPLPNLSDADDAETWEGFDITDRAWTWKETLPAQKLCAYTKLFHGRGTFIDWRLYPSFLRVYGPEGDPEYEYESGRLEKADRDLYLLVEDSGPVDSRKLWQMAKPIFGGKRHRFIASLDRLQAKFYLTVAGGSLEGWSLHTWDLVERQVPSELLTRIPGTQEARANILKQTIANCYAVSEKKLRSILRWKPDDIQRSLEMLKSEGVVGEVNVEGEEHPWWMELNHSRR